MPDHHALMPDLGGEPLDDDALTYPAHLRCKSIEIARGALVIAGPWHVHVHARVLGAGEHDFREAARRVHSWQMHRSAGIDVVEIRGPEYGREDGDVVSLRPVLWGVPLPLTARCRVVQRLDGERESGFAYGTTAGHPERGEEAFLVHWLADDRVVGTIGAFSQPASPAVRLAGPAARAVQRAIARRYLAALTPSE